MAAHHTVNGCNLISGDLIGTGTISGPTEAELSSMLELTLAGTRPITLPNGERRGFLLDGDEIRFEGRCTREGYASIGFGACVGRIEGAAERLQHVITRRSTREHAESKNVYLNTISD